MLVTSLIPNALLRKACRVLRGFTVRSFLRDTRFSLVRWGNFDGRAPYYKDKLAKTEHRVEVEKDYHIRINCPNCADDL